MCRSVHLPVCYPSAAAVSDINLFVTEKVDVSVFHYLSTERF